MLTLRFIIFFLWTLIIFKVTLMSFSRNNKTDQIQNFAKNLEKRKLFLNFFSANQTINFFVAFQFVEGQDSNGATTICIMTQRIMTLSITIFNIMTFYIMKLCIIILSVSKLSINNLRKMTLSIKQTQHNFILIVIIQSVVMLIVEVPKETSWPRNLTKNWHDLNIFLIGYKTSFCLIFTEKICFYIRIRL